MLIDIAPTTLNGFHLADNPPQILLRVFALQSFTSDDGLRIVQPGAPNEGPFYKEVSCALAANVVTIPALQLESQSDAFNVNEQGARYYAAFYRTDGGFITPFQPLANFHIRHDYQPTDWAEIIKYNTAPFYPAGPRETYNRRTVDSMFRLLSLTSDISTGDGAVSSVFGRVGDIVALANDYDIPKITGLQSALDQKAGLPHYHDASAITGGFIAPARLGSGTTDSTTFLRGDGTWQLISSISGSPGPGGTVSSVFGRTGVILPLADDYDIPKISGLQSALDSKANLPHYHDGSAITAGYVAPARLGTGLTGGGSTQFLRGDGVWATPGSVSGVDDTASFTWTGSHIFKSRFGGAFTVQGAAGKEILGITGDDGVSALNWASIRLIAGGGAFIRYDVDGTFNNRKELRLDGTGYHIRGGPIAYEVSTDGTTWLQYAGASFTGGNTSFNIAATAAGSQAAGFTIGGLSALMQVYTAGLFNTQAIIGDVVSQFPGKRHGFAFNAADRYSVMIDNDPADGAINTPLFVRYNGQLRRIVSDSSKVLSWGVLSGTPDATVFLRGDGVWATPAGTGPGGAVSSVGLTVDLTMFASPGPAVTSSGTLNVAFAPQTGPKILVGPGSGSAVPSFRLLTTTDIPPLDASVIATGLISPARLGTGPSGTNYLRSDGLWHDPPGGTGSGTVTSVGLSIPSSLFSLTVTGGAGVNPITVNGTFTLALQSVSPVTFFAGPLAGQPNAAPTFRGLTPGDFPLLPASVIGSGVFPAARLGTGASSSNFLRGDGVYATPSTSASVTGPALTLAAFDGSGNLMTSAGTVPVEFDVGAANVHFKSRGLQLDSGYAYTQKFSGGNTCVIVYAQDGGTADPTGKGLLLFGAPNASDGLTGSSATGLRVMVRCGTGSPGDGSGRGDLMIDGRLTGSDLVAPGSVAGLPPTGGGGVAGMIFKGWLGVNWWATSTGKPLAPTAPLTVNRNDNGSYLVHLRQRGSFAGVGLAIQGFGLTNPSSVEREMFVMQSRFVNATDTTKNSQVEFWVVKNGANSTIPQLYVAGATGPTSTGLWLQSYLTTSTGDMKEVVLGDVSELPGYRVLMLPA